MDNVYSRSQRLVGLPEDTDILATQSSLTMMIGKEELEVKS